MDEFCYDLAIRQKKCQNGVSITSDNIFTNIQDDTQYSVSFGYVINIVSRNRNSVTIQLSNPDLLENVKFNIPNDSFKSFDLPLYNGTFILLIGVIRKACQCPTLVR